MKKMGNQQFQGFQQQAPQTKKEGEVTISNKKSKQDSSSTPKEGGEYIDFEEVD